MTTNKSETPNVVEVWSDGGYLSQSAVAVLTVLSPFLNRAWRRVLWSGLAIALFIRVLFFQPYTIPSASMEPNLYQGDYIIVTKWSYGYSRHSIIFSPRRSRCSGCIQ